MTEEEAGKNWETLIGKAQARDTAALQKLLSRYVEQLLRCATSLCHERQMAEDIVQETLFETWKSIKLRSASDRGDRL